MFQVTWSVRLRKSNQPIQIHQRPGRRHINTRVDPLVNEGLCYRINGLSVTEMLDTKELIYGRCHDPTTEYHGGHSCHYMRWELVLLKELGSQDCVSVRTTKYENAIFHKYDIKNHVWRISINESCLHPDRQIHNYCWCTLSCIIIFYLINRIVQTDLFIWLHRRTGYCFYAILYDNKYITSYSTPITDIRCSIVYLSQVDICSARYCIYITKFSIAIYCIYISILQG